MSFKQETKEIDGFTFQVNTLPYKDAQKVLLKSNKLLMLKTADVSGAIAEGEFSPLTAAVFMEVNSDDLEFVVDKLAEKCLVKEGSEGPLLSLSSQKDKIFSGRIELMFEWLDFALEVNFAGFLGKLRKAAGSNPALGQG